MNRTDLFKDIFSFLVVLTLVLTITLYVKVGRSTVLTQKTKNITSTTEVNIRPTEPNIGIPIRLIIPKINVDASIETVGLTSTGNLDVPQKIQDSAWYQAGPKPGEIGSAVIDGHLDGLNNLPGVFINLKRLKIGDQIITKDINGQTITFSVTKIESYPANERPDEVFQSNAGVHLNLITCTGTWNKNQKQYAKRLVIFSDRVN